MSEYIITFNDLSIDKQSELIKDMSERLYEDFKEEAQGTMIDCPEKAAKTWQQVFCEAYAVDYAIDHLTSEEWETSVRCYADEQAEEKLTEVYTSLEV